MADEIKDKAEEESSKDECISLAEFYESVPPNQERQISDFASFQRLSSGFSDNCYAKPELRLYCNNELCNGYRMFICTNKSVQTSSVTRTDIINYRCSNCRVNEKTYAVIRTADPMYDKKGTIYKIGEYPPFGPPVPSKLLKLVGSDRDLFLKGRRCETQGLGVGAFTYYRRVVEDQKERILDQIIKVLNKIGHNQEKIDGLEKAKKESQFTKALDMAKDLMPESLLIDGYSPFLLLYRALSEGMHNLSDEECMSYASSIRVVLIELSERLGQALKEEAELKSAVSTLMKVKSPK